MLKRQKKVKIAGIFINEETEKKRQELMANGIVWTWLVEKVINDTYQEEIGQFKSGTDGVSEAELKVLRAIHESEENALQGS